MLESNKAFKAPKTEKPFKEIVRPDRGMPSASADKGVKIAPKLRHEHDSGRAAPNAHGSNSANILPEKQWSMQD
ncbi:MAG: hypothetical protein ACI4JF_01440 [Oscillospiraceae bacterium]